MTSCGWKLRILTIVDNHSRYAPATGPPVQLPGEDVVRTLERVCREVGYPKMIRVDNNSEFITRDLDLRAYQRDVVLDFSRTGKPTDNAYVESLNGKFPAECLNQHWLLGLGDARQIMEEGHRLQRGWTSQHHRQQTAVGLDFGPPGQEISPG